MKLGYAFVEFTFTNLCTISTAGKHTSDHSNYQTCSFGHCCRVSFRMRSLNKVARASCPRCQRSPFAILVWVQSLQCENYLWAEVAMTFGVALGFLKAGHAAANDIFPKTSGFLPLNSPHAPSSPSDHILTFCQRSTNTVCSLLQVVWTLLLQPQSSGLRNGYEPTIGAVWCLLWIGIRSTRPQLVTLLYCAGTQASICIHCMVTCIIVLILACRIVATKVYIDIHSPLTTFGQRNNPCVANQHVEILHMLSYRSHRINFWRFWRIPNHDHCWCNPIDAFIRWAHFQATSC